MIRKRQLFVSLLISFLIFSCSATNNSLSQEEENQELIAMLVRIQTQANSVTCIDASQWEITPYGSKPCGGPNGYIAYSNSIDTVDFLELVEAHRLAEKEYNTKWGIASDCAITPEPNSVVCENEKAVLVYE